MDDHRWDSLVLMCPNLLERSPKYPLVLQHLIVVNETMVIPPLVCLGLLARLLNIIVSVSGLYCWIESGYSDSMRSVAQPSWCLPVAPRFPQSFANTINSSQSLWLLLPFYSEDAAWSVLAH